MYFSISDCFSLNDDFFFIEYKFSDFWQGKNPGLYFGEGDFFKTWDKDEWNAFYNFGFFCVRCFLKHGLQSVDYDKRDDNYSAYFANDVVEDEMKRILENKQIP